MNSDFLKVSKAQAGTLIENWGRYAYKVKVQQEVGNHRLTAQYTTMPTGDLHEIVEYSTECRYGMGKVYPQNYTSGSDYILKERLEIRVGKVWYGFYLDGSH